jgi:hypothetical protein
MKNSRLLILLLLTLHAIAQSNQFQPSQSPADHVWFLDQATLTYHMSHPMHEVDGVSHAAKGKGVCHAGQCDFLLAVPVKSFDSGDTNRDLHMLQVTRGAQSPIVTVRLRLPESSISTSTLDCDLEVQFAGKTAHYFPVPFTQSSKAPRTTSKVSFLQPSPILRSSPPRFSLFPSRMRSPFALILSGTPCKRCIREFGNVESARLMMEAGRFSAEEIARSAQSLTFRRVLTSAALP